MNKAPLLVRVVPRGLRLRLKAWIRPLARRFFEAYADDFLDGPAPHPDPKKQHTRFESRVIHQLMTSEFAPNKHDPVRPFEKSYMLAKPKTGVPVAPDGFPHPPDPFWRPFDNDLDHYYEIARINIEKMRAILSDADSDIRPGDRVLDLGCASGTMMRVLREFAETGEVWGADIWGDAVTWAMQNLSPPFRFVKTDTGSHLPFEDNYFDLIYCGSVFSHLGENADAWLCELARVIRPGGHLYLTYSSKRSMHSYLDQWSSLGFSKEIREAFTEREINSNFDMLVCSRSQYLHSVFDQGYFHNKCRGRFDVISDTPNTYTFQHGLLLRKRPVERASGLIEAKSTGEPARI